MTLAFVAFKARFSITNLWSPDLHRFDQEEFGWLRSDRILSVLQDEAQRIYLDVRLKVRSDLGKNRNSKSRFHFAKQYIRRRLHGRDRKAKQTLEQSHAVPIHSKLSNQF
jgi:hypothetical protein